ncbi:MAG: hypothetical protein APF78_12225, partial [Sphingomonadales bacterium BRH_c3]
MGGRCRKVPPFSHVRAASVAQMPHDPHLAAIRLTRHFPLLKPAPIRSGCLRESGSARTMSDAHALKPLPLSSEGWRDEIGATFRLAWPLALANLLQMLVHA